MKIRKGQYGYRDQHKKSRALLTGLVCGCHHCAADCAAADFRTGRKKYPDCHGYFDCASHGDLASPLLASWKYRTGRSSSFYREGPFL